MTNLSHSEELNRWLVQVTNNLPTQQVHAIRAEMTAHVEDAIEDYVQQGIPQVAAYQRALDDLGDPQQVARRFSDVHRGRRHYRGAMVACFLLLIQQGVFYQLYAVLNIVDYSLISRLLFIADHIVWASLVIYVVIVLRWLLLWRFDHSTVDSPVKIIIGGFVIYLIGNIGLESTLDSWSPNPTLSNTSDPLEWVGVLAMHGGMLISSAGTAWFGVRALPVKNRTIKGLAYLASLEGGLTFVTLVLLDLDVDGYIFVHAFAFLFELLLWPAIGLLFFQTVFALRRLPRQMA